MTDIKIIQGEFFTPDIWAKKANSFLDEKLPNWKEKFVVWDCAAGQGALVKDLTFGRLFQSTINQHDVDYLNEHFKNSENFQFDFLNDDDSKIPSALRDLLEEDFPIIFYINPPFGKTYTSPEQHLSDREYFPTTKLFYDRLNKEDFGKSASSQLYIQFIYKIMLLKEKYRLTKLKLAIFAPPFFLTGGTFKKFRKRFFEDFTFKEGFLMDAKNFDSVSSWRLSFTLFDGIENHRNENDFIYHIAENINNNIEIVGRKIIYNLDNKEQALKWVKKDLPKAQLDCPQISNPLKFKEDGRGYMIPDALGFFYNDTNYVKTNVQGVAIFSTGFYKGLGCPITKENLLRVTSLFAARRVFLKPKWYEEHDEYIAPFAVSKSWQDRTLIYSLFNNKSFQTSLRDIEYKEKKWDIKNKFFWLTKDYVRELATKHNNQKILKDLETAEDTYVSEYITSFDVYNKSKEISDVMDIIKKLFDESFSLRETFDEKYQLNTWDAGYAQLKWLWKKHFKEDYKEFKRKYKILENSIFPEIYKLEFLKGDVRYK